MTGNMVIVSMAGMGGIAAALSLFLAYADKKLKVEDDPRIEALLNILPNTNCGGCGRAGCRVFAEALVQGTASVNGCVAGGQVVADNIAEYLGVGSGHAHNNVAVVVCRRSEE